jgi:hypothetical protein
MVLGQRRDKNPVPRLVAAAILAGFIGCALFSVRPERSGFSHRVHTEKGLTCDACHYGYEADAEAGMPTYKTCLACHGAKEERPSYPFELEIQKHAAEETFVAGARYYDLKFSHAVHYRRSVFCESCHDGIDMADAVSPSDRPAAPDCVACHLREGIGTVCSLCHEHLSRDTRPPSHERSTWHHDHGRDPASVAMRGHQDSCTLCHLQSFCNRCHQIEKPRDHTEYWRIQGHGIAVGIERERCMVCHQENYCIRCHRETRPRSHAMASWGGRQSNHCLACHEPLGSAECSVCHQGTPDHAAAPPIPGPPHPLSSANCYQCHLRPPHADNGSPCTGCHR